jgi:hypothetical protein
MSKHSDSSRGCFMAEFKTPSYGEQEVKLSLSEASIRQDSDVHIVFLLAHGFAARMVIRSGLAKQLTTRGARVTVISPNADEAYFQQECQAEDVAVKQEPKSADRIAYWFRAYRPYLLDDVMNNPTLEFLHLKRFENRPMLGLSMKIINRTLARWHLFRRMSRTLESRINRSTKVENLLHTLKPDLLVLSTPFGLEDALYLLHAKELGIPVVCQILSWDNITSKGTPLLMPDYFISWGPIMTEEIIELYQFPKDKIYECGVPHFDVYHQADQLIPRHLLLQELNLPVEHPYIFYGMVAQLYCPNELEILAWLADQINKNSFVKPCSLVIRPHPQTISGYYASSARDLEKLKTLISPRVALDVPPVLSEQLAWDLPKSDMYHLASLLAGCAMCVNANSTLCLDACMLGRPVIDIGFDGWEDLPYERSARTALDFIHMAKLLSLGGVRIARSFKDLENHINAYLCNPSLDQQGRLLSALKECGPLDGQATDRAAETLLNLAIQAGH